MSDNRSALQIRRDVIARESSPRQIIVYYGEPGNLRTLAVLDAQSTYPATGVAEIVALINNAAERDRLRAVNAAMLAALKAVESITRDLPLPSVHNVINHAITAASGETT